MTAVCWLCCDWLFTVFVNLWGSCSDWMVTTLFLTVFQEDENTKEVQEDQCPFMFDSSFWKDILRRLVGESFNVTKTVTMTPKRYHAFKSGSHHTVQQSQK